MATQLSTLTSHLRLKLFGNNDNAVGRDANGFVYRATKFFLLIKLWGAIHFLSIYARHAEFSMQQLLVCLIPEEIKDNDDDDDPLSHVVFKR